MLAKYLSDIKRRSMAASLTHGLPTSTYQSYSTRDAALTAYQTALRHREVEELEMGQPYYYRT